MALLVSKRGFALHPIDDITIDSYRDLQLEVWSLVVAPPTQTVLIYGNAIVRMRSWGGGRAVVRRKDGSAGTDQWLNLAPHCKGRLLYAAKMAIFIAKVREKACVSMGMGAK